MNKSRYPTKVRTLFAVLLILTLLAAGAGIFYFDNGPDFDTSSAPWAEILKEEGPGLRKGGPKSGVEMTKEEGPGLNIGDQLVKEEGPGLRKGKPGSAVQVVKEEGPGLPGVSSVDGVEIVKEEGPGLSIDS